MLDTAVIYPTKPRQRIEEATRIVKGLIKRHHVDVIAIGNGTASKESEIFICNLLKEIPEANCKYIVVNEAGASIYSASKLATEEFPDFDVTERSAVSIARRLQDPLAELVKIDPKSIGVGQYQHDMKPARLDGALTGVVEDCVNAVGVDVNRRQYNKSFKTLKEVGWECYDAGKDPSVIEPLIKEAGDFKMVTEADPDSSTFWLFIINMLMERGFQGDCKLISRVDGDTTIMEVTDNFEHSLIIPINILYNTI